MPRIQKKKYFDDFFLEKFSTNIGIHTRKLQMEAELQGALYFQNSKITIKI
jgi:hypothetical protein